MIDILGGPVQSQSWKYTHRSIHRGCPISHANEKREGGGFEGGGGGGVSGEAKKEEKKVNYCP